MIFSLLFSRENEVVHTHFNFRKSDISLPFVPLRQPLLLFVCFSRRKPFADPNTL